MLYPQCGWVYTHQIWLDIFRLLFIYKEKRKTSHKSHVREKHLPLYFIYPLEQITKTKQKYKKNDCHARFENTDKTNTETEADIYYFVSSHYLVIADATSYNFLAKITWHLKINFSQIKNSYPLYPTNFIVYVQSHRIETIILDTFYSGSSWAW